MHDAFYQIEFHTAADGQLYFSTGLLPGPAEPYCLSAQSRVVFLPGTYSATLTVYNDCGDSASETVTFSLPLTNSNSECPDFYRWLKIKSVYPNPVTENLQVEYDVRKEGTLSTWIIPATNGSNEILMATDYINVPDTYQKTLDLQPLSEGTYFLVLELDGEVIGKTLIKI